MFRFSKGWDWLFVGNIILLVVFGLATIYSLRFNKPESDGSLFTRQLIFALIGLALFMVLSYLHYRWVGVYYKIFYWLAALLLVAVLFLGVTIHGTKGWLLVVGQTFQPVEFAKLALIVWLSRYYGEHLSDIRVWRTVLVGAAITLVLVALVLRQPDFGSALILLIIWASLSFFLALPRKLYWQALVVIIIAVTIGWFGLADYQQARITSFINPQLDPQGSGYNVRQAMIAVGSGKLWGRGFSLGSQSQLNFLPQPEADFIFSVISEVFGFLGAGILLGLFLILLWRLLKFSLVITDPFGSLLQMGTFVYIFIQLLINVGMNIGLLPVMGIPLPLISAGGSSLLVSLCLLGLVHSVRVHQSKLSLG
ncbi:MAG: FtsW/RodA/SpoVE family cell cycle protein [Candidatus Komeilibacteria bacterium]|nr:FtsW/RodA/SpoVE family cell cycle protein [Candidatus Komeilibacteria bacterium]